MAQQLIIEQGGLRGLIRLEVAELVRAGALLDNEQLDHLITGDGRWVCLRRLGLGFAPASP